MKPCGLLNNVHTSSQTLAWNLSFVLRDLCRAFKLEDHLNFLRARKSWIRSIARVSLQKHKQFQSLGGKRESVHWKCNNEIQPWETRLLQKAEGLVYRRVRYLRKLPWRRWAVSTRKNTDSTWQRRESADPSSSPSANCWSVPSPTIHTRFPQRADQSAQQKYGRTPFF